MEPAAVIVEILNEDGTMARRPDLERFAREHQLKIGTIADLIRYRLEKDRLIERIAERPVNTEFGPFRMFCFEDHVNRTVHLALVRGELGPDAVPLVRVHLPDTLRDLLAIRDDGLGLPLRAAMERIAQETSGVIIVLRPGESPRELMDAVQSMSRPADHAAPSTTSGTHVLRTYGIGAQILKDLGLTRMRVLSAPKQLQGLSGFDLEIVGYVHT